MINKDYSTTKYRDRGKLSQQLGRSPGEGDGKPLQRIPSILVGTSHGHQRSLVGYRPLAHKQLDTTEQLTAHLRFLSLGMQRRKQPSASSVINSTYTGGRLDIPNPVITSQDTLAISLSLSHTHPDAERLSVRALSSCAH